MQTASRWEDVADLIRPTGIDNIDHDHRRLTEIALELNNMMLGGGGEFSLDQIQQQGAVLESTYSYARHHFQREERIIELFNLPDGDRQRRQHQEFLSMVEAAIQDFRNGKLTVGLHLKTWILEWWVNHINQVDYHTFGHEHWHIKAIGRSGDWSTLSEIVFATQLDTVDEEHRGLAELVFRLIRDRDGDRGPLIDHFSDLHIMAQRHFIHEETIIELYELPQLAVQRAQHATFLTTLDMLTEDLEHQDEAELEEVLRQILNWWVKHINEVDRRSFDPLAIEERVYMQARSWDDFSVFVRSVGEPEVDADHRRITNLFLRLDDIIGDDEPDPEIRDACVELLGAAMGEVREHFGHEERLMREHGSDLYKVHADSHAKFVSMIKSMQLDLEQGRMAVSRNLKRRILAWWVNHINTYDFPTFMAFARKDDATT